MAVAARTVAPDRQAGFYGGRPWETQATRGGWGWSRRSWSSAPPRTSTPRTPRRARSPCSRPVDAEPGPRPPVWPRPEGGALPAAPGGFGWRWPLWCLCGSAVGKAQTGRALRLPERRGVKVRGGRSRCFVPDGPRHGVVLRAVNAGPVVLAAAGDGPPAGEGCRCRPAPEPPMFSWLCRCPPRRRSQGRGPRGCGRQGWGRSLRR